jgi:hypothetical protein
MRVRQSDLTWEQLDDEIVILDLARSNYLKLNGAGALLWVSLVEGAERQELADALVERYELDADRAWADVDAFVTQLQSEGLLEGTAH